MAKKDEDSDPSTQVSSVVFSNLDSVGSVVLKEEPVSAGEGSQAAVVKGLSSSVRQVFAKMSESRSMVQGAVVVAEEAGEIVPCDGEVSSHPLDSASGQGPPLVAVIPENLCVSIPGVETDVGDAHIADMGSVAAEDGLGCPPGIGVGGTPKAHQTLGSLAEPYK
ncbi:hypothetical protein U1Q18_000627, partial [Sarracenia purpurea var. burkii]